jgi:hypothetical protein
MTQTENLFDTQPFWLIVIVVLVVLAGANWIGQRARQRRGKQALESEPQGYVISSVLGLLALLLGFTFSLAIDRFETRRTLVLEEANAIRTAYLQADTFADPYRSRLKELLAAYADNHLAIGEAQERSEVERNLAADTSLQRAIWSESVAAIATMRDDISSTYMGSVNSVIDLGAARRTAREAHVPRRVFVMILLYMAVSAGLLGYVIGPRHRISVVIMLGLSALAYLLIFDIDSATRGGIRESQAPMEELHAFLAAARAPPLRSSRGSAP